MTSYWLTFRIADLTVDGRTYDDRYDDLKLAIRAHAHKWWLEPTSFIAFASDHDAMDVAAACKRAIAPEYDMFLMRMMDQKTAYICGANEDPDIFELMPYLKRI